MTTQLTLDLHKVVYARYWYEQQNGLTVKYKPLAPSTYGVTFDSKAYAAAHHDYPSETLLERAKRLDILDVWTPRCQVRTTNGRTITYSGNRAVKIWSAYNAKIFNKGKNN